MALVLPDHPAPGRAFSDASIARVRKEVPEAVATGHFQVFCLGTSASQSEGEHYRPIYVHAKVAIVDDLWVTVGSANLNNRGLRDDVEINVATLDADLARSLRLLLWAEHLGLLTADELFALNIALQHQPLQDSKEKHILLDSKMLNAWQEVQKNLQDPMLGIQMMRRLAQENLAAYKTRHPLAGHLMPYMLEDEAHQQGLHFSEEHGWLEEDEKVVLSKRKQQ